MSHMGLSLACRCLSLQVFCRCQGCCSKRDYGQQPDRKGAVCERECTAADSDRASLGPDSAFPHHLPSLEADTGPVPPMRTCDMDVAQCYIGQTAIQGDFSITFCFICQGLVRQLRIGGRYIAKCVRSILLAVPLPFSVHIKRAHVQSRKYARCNHLSDSERDCLACMGMCSSRIGCIAAVSVHITA